MSRTQAAHRRRGHRRPAPERDPVRSLLPRALVVAALAGGTSAFVAQDKKVTLDVDGTTQTLHTYADDVRGVLAQQGVTLGEHDTVVPAPGRPLTDGAKVGVRHGRPLILTLDGERRRVWTTAETVREALRGLGVRTAGASLTAPLDAPIPRTGLVLEVRTERSVTVLADGREHTVRTNAATVREAVEQAGLALGEEDTTSVPPGSPPRDGQTVSVMRIRSGTEHRDLVLPYRSVRRPDPTAFQGTEMVEQQGRPGLKRITYAVRTVNGVRQRPRVVGTRILRQPTDRIVRVGSMPLPNSVGGPVDGLNWDAMARCESGGRPDAVNSAGTHGGLYQFDVPTWHRLGGAGRPQDAPAAEQTYRAKKLYVLRGAAPWPGCGRKLLR